MFGFYVDDIFVVALTYGLVTLGLYVTLASGQFSVAHAALMGLGGYMGGWATTQWNLPFPIAIILGGLAGGLGGLLIAFILQRTSGILLGTVTIAIGQSLSLVAQNTEFLGASQGLTGIPLKSDLPTATILMALALTAVLLIQRTSFGMQVVAAGRDETVARSLGVSILGVRLYGFGFGGFLAGLGGVLLAHHNGVIDPSNLSYAFEPLFFIFLVLGGYSSAWGAVLGAIGVTWIMEALRFNGGTFLFLDQQDRPWLLGLVLVIVLIISPDGAIRRKSIKTSMANAAKVG
jgi:branched-chain amino acid transport system permease protein